MSLEDAKIGIAALREANDRVAAGYRYAMMDHGDNDIIGVEGERRNNAYVADMQREWRAGLVAFRSACERVAPEIDGSLRLVDVETIDDNWLTIRHFVALDTHVHELFGEIRSRWPTLAVEPPLTDHEDDDRALRADWRIALERRPVLFVAMAVFVVWWLASFLWMIVSNM